MQVVGIGIMGGGWLWKDLHPPPWASGSFSHGTGHESDHSDCMDVLGQVGEEGLQMQVWEDALEMRLGWLGWA